jgi:hypothetical protein
MISADWGEFKQSSLPHILQPATLYDRILLLITLHLKWERIFSEILVTTHSNKSCHATQEGNFRIQTNLLDY